MECFKFINDNTFLHNEVTFIHNIYLRSQTSEWYDGVSKDRSTNVTITIEVTLCPHKDPDNDGTLILLSMYH